MKMKWQRNLLLVAALLVLIVAAACSGYGGYGTTPAPAPAPTTGASQNSVTIANFAFSPATLTVKAGTTVTWTNKDSATHTVTSDTGAFDSGNVANNATYSYTFGSAGTFAYYCGIHPAMKATVVVQ